MNARPHDPRMSARPRDLRRTTIALTLGAIALLGAAVTWLPRDLPLREHVSALVGGPVARDRNHAQTKRAQEIRSRFDQGVVMLHAKHYDHALTAFHRVLQLAPDLPEAHVNLGFALVGLRRFETARDFFESATVLRRDQANAYYGLALALDGLGDRPGAIGAMRAYVHLASGADAHVRKAQAALWEWEADPLAQRGDRSGTPRAARSGPD